VAREQQKKEEERIEVQTKDHLKMHNAQWGPLREEITKCRTRNGEP
jgi:hypothetical protein